MRKLIIKRLSINLLLTFLLSSFLTFIAIQIYYSKEAGSLEGNQGIFIMVLAAVFWTLILTLLSLTVFLNLNNNVRHNKIYRLLTFFLLPFIATIIVFIKSDFEDMWQSFFIVTITFFVVQTYFFIKFLKTRFEQVTIEQKIDVEIQGEKHSIQQ